MEYTQRQYPLFSACGLNCGLCPRHHTDGTSKCPGCAGEGFLEKHPSCGALSCCQRKSIEFCYLCEEYPCEKYDGADLYDSFITHRNQLHDFNKVKRIGPEAYIAELNRKIQFLEHLLQNYDDGRRKSFYCVAVNLLELQDIISVLERLAHDMDSDTPAKEKAKIAARLFENMAVTRGISLQLRKKSKA